MDREQLKVRRVGLGLGRRAMAEQLGISRRTYERYEAGTRADKPEGHTVEIPKLIDLAIEALERRRYCICDDLPKEYG